MSRNRFQPTKTIIALAVTAALTATTATTYADTSVHTSNIHTFSVDDVIGDLQGWTYGSSGAHEDKSIICGLPDSVDTTCPGEAQPFLDKSGVMMYPTDSVWGAYVVDFLGVQFKERDGDYAEGFAGDLPDGTGIAISNSATSRYKVKAPQGTWCQGLGGNSVKCSTEHYTVLEHVLSCHEVIPYFYADPETGEQGTQTTPDGTKTLDCATTTLDDVQLILVDGVEGNRLVDATPCEIKVSDTDYSLNTPAGCQMLPNDKETMLDDLSVSNDYAITLKDDGKPLYRWGALVKFPNDMRMYARLSLPDAWKARGEPTEEEPLGALLNDFPVVKARLTVHHTVTNNPNDQIRPEDMENEAAIGVLPDHTIENEGTADEVWKSTKLCYEGDGDLIDNEEGIGDPDVLGIGTFYKNMPFVLDPEATPGELSEDPPYAFSEDLYAALTNAWYTTIDREPFMWSYEVVTMDGDVKTVDYRACAGPVDDPLYAAECLDVPEGAPLFSGPRWRLLPNKFGQDIPGLEIPVTAGTEEPCIPPPFGHDDIKYEVGTPATVVLNLLDWDTEEEGPSPLVTSKGWVDSANYNHAIEIVDTVTDDNGEIRQITSIGSPMSEDFDMAVYVKGDRKPTFLYDAQLVVEYEGGSVLPPEPLEADLVLATLDVPSVVRGRDDRVKTVSVEVCNATGDDASGTVDLVGVSRVVYDPAIEDAVFSGTVSDLVAGGECQTLDFVWNVDNRGTTMDWTATVTPFDNITDTDPSNNTATDSTLVYQAR